MKDNQYKPNLEKIYIIQEQPVKKSNLSSVARSKVINKAGSNYQSQNPENYGPCIPFNQNCECSLEELQRQEQILKNKEVEERTNRARGTNDQNVGQNDNQQNEELQRLRNEFVNLQINCNNLQEQTNALTQERNNLQS